MMSFPENVPEEFRSGFVALIGRPNVGKSTLVNKIIGKKIAITSPVSQTTRNRLKAILTTPKAQLIFVDTPGIHKPKHLLGERLLESSKRAIGEVDAIVLIFDGNELPGRGDFFLVEMLKEQKIPIITVLNKWDLLSVNEYEKRINDYKNLINKNQWPLLYCSAIDGTGCNKLIDNIVNLLPRGPSLYPSEMISDQTEEILLSELIREQVLLNTREEIPHSVAVKIDKIEEDSKKKKKGSDSKKMIIFATILVERKSQKGIIIGKGGSMLKMIGKGARLQMQKLINGPIYLELFVKVVPDWRSKPARLKELGYIGN